MDGAQRQLQFMMNDLHKGLSRIVEEADVITVMLLFLIVCVLL